MSDQTRVSILYHPKDAPQFINSGYAKIAMYTTPYLLDAGFDTRLHCPVGQTQSNSIWTEPRKGKTMEIWGGGSGAYGEDIIPLHMRHLTELTGKPSMLLFCGDVIALDQVPKWAREKSIAAAAWGAVDWEWPTPKWALEKISPYMEMWPMSRWGQGVLMRDGLKNVRAPIWCGVDTKIWHPVNPSDFPQVKASMGYGDDTFNVFSAFANQYLRKGEQEMFQAIGEFHKRHPEAKIRFFGLTQVRRDWDLVAAAEHYGITDLVRWSDDYQHIMGLYPEEDVALMMGVSDCVLSLGYEGFGFQTVEAQALERPVIGLNAGATPELLRSGILVPAERTLAHTSMIGRARPDGPKVVEALETIWRAKQDGKRWRAGRRWVEENVTWDRCGRMLVEGVRRVEQALADESSFGPPPPGPLAVERAKDLVVVG